MPHHIHVYEREQGVGRPQGVGHRQAAKPVQVL